VSLAVPSPSLPLRWVYNDPLGNVLKKHAVRMPDGTLEICPVCRSHAGNPKVVFDDEVEAELAAAKMTVLPGAYQRVRAHPCKLWRDVWHVTGAERRE
jgi:hypothetical protein